MQLHRHENRFIKIVATICFLYTPMKITMDETTGLRRSTNLKTNEEKWQLRVMRRSSALLSVVLKINIDTLLYPESSRCCATPLAHCIFILDQNTQIWICNSEAWSIMTQWQRQRLHSVELSINRGGASTVKRSHSSIWHRMVAELTSHFFQHWMLNEDDG